MKIADLNTNSSIMIVAEIGNNHEGSFKLAAEMVRLAAKTCVDAVKFQTFRTEHYVGRENMARFKQMKSFELTFVEFDELAHIAAEEGLIFLSTPFDLISAEFLNGIVPAFKIASGDNTFYPLIDKIASFAKPVIMSTGILDIAGIRAVSDRIKGIWKDIGAAQEVAILHCVCAYPAPPEHANVSAIHTIKREIDCVVGYSDHTIGIDAAILSVAAGARIIEKHFTKDKKLSPFRDHSISADPRDMALLVKKVREAETLMGAGVKSAREPERKMEPQVRRSIAASRNIPAGATLNNDDITWVRPAGGMPPGQEHLVLGKRLKMPLFPGDKILPENLIED